MKIHGGYRYIIIELKLKKTPPRSSRNFFQEVIERNIGTES